MKVLATTDGSDFSAAALRRLGTLLPTQGVEVIVLAVYPDPTFVGMGHMGPPYVDYTLIARQVESEAETFAKAGADALQRQGFSVSTRTLPGDAAAVILDMIDRGKIDMVVVGSHGRTGLTRFLLGSVSARVASHAHCSVLIVKQPVAPKA